MTLGFLKPRDGFCFVQVQNKVAAATSSAAESLAVHVRHDTLTNSSHHFARDATRSAATAGAIDAVETKWSEGVHRRANRAKHNVSACARTANVGGDSDPPTVPKKRRRK